MLSSVTNRSKAVRGFDTLDRGAVLIDPGATALLDLSDHPLHRTWAASGDATIVVLPDKDAKLARKRIEQQAEADAKSMAQALADLPRPERVL